MNGICEIARRTVCDVWLCSIIKIKKNSYNVTDLLKSFYNEVLAHQNMPNGSKTNAAASLDMTAHISCKSLTTTVLIKNHKFRWVYCLFWDIYTKYV